MSMLEKLASEGGRQAIIQRTLDRIFWWCEFFFICLPLFGAVLSTFAAGVWLVTTVSGIWAELDAYRLLGTASERSLPDFRSVVLNSIELLLIIPLPGIVGRVVYQTFGRFMNRENEPSRLNERELVVAKKLLLGSIVAVSATHMLDLALTETGDVWKYVPGALLIVAIGMFVKLGFSETRVVEEPKRVVTDLAPPPAGGTT